MSIPLAPAAWIPASLYRRVNPEALRQQEDHSLHGHEELTRGYCAAHG